MINWIKSNWVLAAILLIAIFFRFWQITELPAGLFPDEAINGLDVNTILQGDFKPFYESNNGREALFFYFLAGMVAIFGRGVWQHHAVSAGIGVIEVLLTYFLAKRLFSKRIALLASFFMAISSYAVTLSRTSFRANLVPLFTTLTLLFLVKFFQEKNPKNKLWSAFAAGISFGFGFYTYISFRMVVPLILVFGGILLYAYRAQLKNLVPQYIKYKMIFGLGFLLSFSWIGHYFITHPQSFIGRAGQVSIFSSQYNNGDPLGTFFTVVGKTLLSFFVSGDFNYRHNAAGFPFLSPFISPFFAVALVWFTYCIFKIIKDAKSRTVNFNTWAGALMAALFWFMLVPEITTAEGIPHGLRLIGIIPAIFIMSAVGVDWAWRRISKTDYFSNSKTAFAAIFLGSMFLYNFYAYFVVTAASPDNYFAFRGDLTTVSEYINNRNQKDHTYLSLDIFSNATVEYLTTEKNRPYIWTAPEKTHETPLKPGDQVIFTQTTIFDRIKFVQANPAAKLIKEERNRWGQLIMLVYEQP